MKLQLKHVIRLFIPIFLVELLLAHMFLNPKREEFSQMESKHNGLSSKLSITAKNIQKITDKLNQLERELSSPITEARLKLSGGVEVPTFLEYISRLVQSLGIKYISIRLNQVEAKSPQVSYNLKVTSEYGQIVRLVDNLENQLNLDIQNFKIKSGEEIPDMHEVSFDLAFLKPGADEGLPAEPEKEETVLKLAQVFSKKKVKRDPFFRKIFPKTGGAAKPEQYPLVLQGVMDFMGKKTALINHHILHEGGNIKGYRLVKINKDNVVLWRRKHRYALSLRGLFSLEDIEIEKERI